MKLFYFILFFLITISFSQDNLIEYQRKLQRIEKEIAREKKFHQQEQEQHQGFTNQKKIKTQNITQQIQELKKDLQKIDKKLQIHKQEKKNLFHNIQENTKNTLLFLKSLQLTIKNWSKKIELSFPHNHKKFSFQFKELYTRINKKELLATNALDQFYQIILDLIAQGYSVENFYGTYANSKGQIFDGHYFRGGNIFYFFISNDQSKFSYLTFKDGQYQWNDNPTSIIKRQIKKTLRVSQGKSPPELVLLPIQINGGSK